MSNSGHVDIALVDTRTMAPRELYASGESRKNNCHLHAMMGSIPFFRDASSVPCQDQSFMIGTMRPRAGLSRATVRYAGVPVWALATPLGLFVALRFRNGYQRYVAAAAKACQNRGYNLTGNTSGVCPECGAKVEIKHVPDARPASTDLSSC